MTVRKWPPLEPGDTRPKARDLEGGTRNLSGNAYVVGELDTSHTEPGGRYVQGLARDAIPIRKAATCDHAETVCPMCAETWMYDWVFRFDRTAGGRQLRDELGGQPGLDAMAGRRAAVAAGTAPATPPGV